MYDPRKIFRVLQVFFYLFLSISPAENLDWKGDGLCLRQWQEWRHFNYDSCHRSSGVFSYYWKPKPDYKSYVVDRFEVQCCQGYREVYRRQNTVQCTPVCNPQCIYSTCIKPNTCQCFSQYYHVNKHTCAPICNPGCINAKCTKATQLTNICQCHFGFKMAKGSKNKCEPVCEKCTNGKCVSPGVCQCDEGFIKKKNSNSECEPKCESPCINSTCIGVGQCQCLLGYARQDDRSCRPECKNGCGLGICTAPEICSCPDGYQAVFGEPCKPICKGCGIGSCVSPNICFCPEGFTLNNITYECDPACDSCNNGQCVKPNECICKPGYAKEEGDVHCKPICSLKCINGLCKGPGICECYEGYKLKLNSSYECEPICSKSCINSTCIAPESCLCMIGYEQISSYSCKPVCTAGCGPGVCIFPDNCQCPSGYHADSGHSCTPTCSAGCENGHCIAPEICVCLAGYALTGGYCEPICNQTCINAECVLPETCECYIGFTNISNFECVPQCNPKCINGYCDSVDVCVCTEGFNSHPEDLSYCLPELDRYTEFGPSASMNIYNFQSTLNPIDDNETYYLSSFPNITIKKPCSLLLMNASSAINDTGPYWDSLPLVCHPHYNTSQFDVKFYCDWPYDNETNHELEDDLRDSSMLNLTLQLETHADLTLYLLFPEQFNTNKTGFCLFSTSLRSGQRYISLYEDIEFVLKIMDNNSEIKEMKMLITTDKGSWWASTITYGLLAACIISSVALLTIIVKYKRRQHITLKISEDDKSEDTFL